MTDRTDEDPLVRALFHNAIFSIEMGVEDSEAGDSARELSAVRNLHAGLLLLAKWILVTRAPNASMSDVLATRYEPKLDDNGVVAYQPIGQQTIGLQDIRRLFKLFGLSLSSAANEALDALAQARNAIEHRYPDTQGPSLPETVSRSYLVAAELFRLGGASGLDPYGLFLGDTWSVMLRNRQVYERELSACRETFKDVVWGFPASQPPSLRCPVCDSELIEQIPPLGPSPDRLVTNCRSCSQIMVVPTGFQHRFLENGWFAVLTACPLCHNDTYVKEFRDDAYVVSCESCDFEATHTLPSDMLVSPDDQCAVGFNPFTYYGSWGQPRP